MGERLLVLARKLITQRWPQANRLDLPCCGPCSGLWWLVVACPTPRFSKNFIREIFRIHPSWSKHPSRRASDHQLRFFFSPPSPEVPACFKKKNQQTNSNRSPCRRAPRRRRRGSVRTKPSSRSSSGTGRCVAVLEYQQGLQVQAGRVCCMIDHPSPISPRQQQTDTGSRPGQEQ
jgi:hypothetical protein